MNRNRDYLLQFFEGIGIKTDLKPDEYQCARCKGVFKKEWSDEEAMVESRSYFGADIKQEECAVICDDCFNKIHPQRN